MRGILGVMRFGGCYIKGSGGIDLPAGIVGLTRGRQARLSVAGLQAVDLPAAGLIPNGVDFSIFS